MDTHTNPPFGWPHFYRTNQNPTYKQWAPLSISMTTGPTLTCNKAVGCLGWWILSMQLSRISSDMRVIVQVAQSIRDCTSRSLLWQPPINTASWFDTCRRAKARFSWVAESALALRIRLRVIDLCPRSASKSWMFNAKILPINKLKRIPISHFVEVEKWHE